MGHVARRLVFQLHRQVDDAHALLHVRRGDVAHPARDRRREQENLQVTPALAPTLSEDLIEREGYRLASGLETRRPIMDLDAEGSCPI